MATARLSSKGQLVVPAQIRAALGLRAGDELTLRLEGNLLLIEKDVRPSAKLVRSKLGRRVLKAPSGAPKMTVGVVSALLDELP